MSLGATPKSFYNMKKIIFILLGLLLAAIALPAQIIELKIDSTNIAKMQICNTFGCETVDLGEWITVYNESQTSPAGDYRTALIRSQDTDENALPLWWAYIVIVQDEQENVEFHFNNMVIYQGSRFIMNSISRPVQWDMMWQRCQF